MSKLQLFREFLRETLRTGALEIFGAVEKHFAEYEEEICRNKEECARLQRVLDIVTQHNSRRHRTDVQQLSLQEPPQIKEELWTNQEEEQLQQMLTDTTNSIFTKESEMSNVKMSKLQEFEEFHKEILTKAALEIFRTVEKTFADYEEKICCTKEESARLQRLLDILTQPQIKLHRADVQQFSLQEPPQIKEELWTNQEEEQLQGLQSDPTDSIFTSPSVKNHCDQDSYELPHLDQTVKVESSEGDTLTTNTTEEQIKAEPDEKDCGAPEPARDSTPLSVVTPDCPTAQSSEEESGGRLPPLQQTPELKSPNDDLINHVKNHRLRKPCQCQECNKTTDAQPKNNHRFDSPECGECFVTPYTLNNHVTCHTGEELYPCQECNKAFDKKSNLVKHTRTHTGEKPHQCQECNKAFYQKNQLVEHSRIHTGEKTYQCQECNKAFNQRSVLYKHTLAHTGEKQHQCQDCNMKFLFKDQLVRHRRVHTGEKPYQCQECDKTFESMSHLNDHVNTHTTQNKHQCQICSKAFKTKSYLAHHTLRHSGVKPFPCLECDRAYAQKASLVSHMRTHTGEAPFQCRKCKKTFNRWITLATHKKKHRGKKSCRYQTEGVAASFALIG